MTAPKTGRLARGIGGIALCALPLLAAGCEEAEAPRTPQVVTGFWVGTAAGRTFELLFREEADRSFTGNGAIRPALTTGSIGLGDRRTGAFPDDRRPPDEPVAVLVLGTNIFPLVSFTLRSRGFEDINFLGEFIGRDQLRGRLNGSGFENVLLRLRRREFVPTLGLGPGAL